VTARYNAYYLANNVAVTINALIVDSHEVHSMQYCFELQILLRELYYAAVRHGLAMVIVHYDWD